jgi:hypothetical protein
LATAIILVAGLGLGREAILGWWKVRAPEPPVSTMEGASARPEIALAHARNRWQSAAFVGTREAAVAELVKRCLAAAKERADSGHAGAPLDGALLASAKRLESSGEIDIYLADDELPLIAAVKTTGNERRVLCWGLGSLRPAEDSEDDTTANEDVTASEWTLTIVAAQDSAPPGDSAP